MSIESDARACLIEAVAEDGTILMPENLATAKPNDEFLRYQDDLAWLKVLNRAASCMRARGHQLSEPDVAEAGKLLDKILASSVRYLVELGRSTWATDRNLLMGGASAVAVAAVAWSAWRITRRGKAPPAEPKS